MQKPSADSYGQALGERSGATSVLPPFFSQANVMVVCGHYGVGKTNFALNVACDVAAQGKEVTLVDLDVVNPYFRSSDYDTLLNEHKVHLIAPVFSGAHTNLDSPSISGAILPAIQQAQAGDGLLIIDAGGDDAGAMALGRFAQSIALQPYEMYYVINAQRNLTQHPEEAASVLREIEDTCHLQAGGVVNNTHLQGETNADIVAKGIVFAQSVSQQVGLPLVCSTVPEALVEGQSVTSEEFANVTDRKCALAEQMGECGCVYPVRTYVRTPWE